MNVITPRFVFKLVSCWLVVAGLCFGKDEVPYVAPEFRFSEPLAETVAWAQKNGWYLSGVVMADGRTNAQSGDEVIALAELTEKERRKQWLIRLRMEDMNEDEKGSYQAVSWPVHVITGRVVQMSSSPRVMVSEVVGPFKAGDDGSGLRPKSARSIVKEEYLRAGFYRLGPWFSKWHEIKQRASEEEKALFLRPWWSDNKPHGEEVVRRGRKLIEYGVTSEDEQTYLMHWPALEEFFQCMRSAPGIKTVVFEVSDMTYFDLAWNFMLRRNPDPKFDGREGPGLNAVNWPLAGNIPVRSLPYRMSVFGKEVIDFNLAVVPPRPPLLNTAGVLGMAAKRPSGKGPHLMVRLISAKAGTTAAP